MIRHYKKLLFYLLILFFILMFLLLPDTGRKGAAQGLLLCGRVIIPSLYPFTFCVLLVMRSGFEQKLSFLNSITKKIFRLDIKHFLTFILSLLGGYPVGARLIEELYLQNKTNKKTARAMLCCCVNSGPAFTVLFVGEGIFNNITIGYCLLFSSILSSFIILFVLRKKFTTDTYTNSKIRLFSISENFVSSAADASSSMLSICGFIILFSSLNAYILNFPKLKAITYFTEVTYGITHTRNIYLIAFLLGFSGISVWLQIMTSTQKCGIDLTNFIFFRFLHGGLSTGFVYLIIKIFNITVPTVSNNMNFMGDFFYTSATVAVALLIMVIMLLISLTNKKYSGNLLKDML